MSGAAKGADPAVEAVRDAVRTAVAERGAVRVAAGGSKPALSRAATLSVAELTGVVEYEPAEYTVTVRAGTPVRELRELLAAEGQHLPFDPPLAEAGATLGGTVAAGLSGPGRFRYGGVRDFLLGVRFVDGVGELRTGGGRVVKNAAGFDLPKLMVGARGRFGVLVELTFKVFPAPEAHATMVLDAAGLGPAVDAVRRLAASPLEPVCVELAPPARVLVRVGGIAGALDARLDRLRALLGADGQTLRGGEDARAWRDAAEWSWAPAGSALVKVPLSPGRIAPLEDALAGLERTAGGPAGLPRRYGVGGNVAWLSWPDARPTTPLRDMLAGLGLTGLAIRGARFGFGGEDPHLGPRVGGAFLERIASVLDPHGVFAPDGAPAGRSSDTDPTGHSLDDAPRDADGDAATRSERAT